MLKGVYKNQSRIIGSYKYMPSTVSFSKLDVDSISIVAFILLISNITALIATTLSKAFFPASILLFLFVIIATFYAYIKSNAVSINAKIYKKVVIPVENNFHKMNSANQKKYKHFLKRIYFLSSDIQITHDIKVPQELMDINELFRITGKIDSPVEESDVKEELKIKQRVADDLNIKY